tara:strand:- start:302 stop:931 length:630 start_codon:yes stop_codon:yes gene_type:complete
VELEGEYKIAAGRQVVWDALNNPEILKLCIPGCQEIEKNTDTSFIAAVTAKVGPVKANFTGEVELSDLDAPNSYTISGEGKGGAAGFASGGAKIRLSDTEDGGTKLSYKVTAQVGGKLAQIGSRLIDSTAKKLAREFFNEFAAIVDPPVAENFNISSATAGLTGTKEGNKMEDHKETEENVYPRTHWTLWLLGIISVGTLVAFAMHLSI